ncbi:hypothetical protein K6W26_25110 [Burkholderia sp. AU42008]|uniref:hypothetical protein n=1 Tax=unclassified Burkholderia TaxID=2613784 RepID=UPI001178ACB9|nr:MULTISPECIES: hypothetical protein [unclassified Burkholderia]MBR8233134.1 hypothetical protein [Burkholderia sp. AU32357]MBY4876336.1 hypothetical protein [Burkholderia sp. AU42008]
MVPEHGAVAARPRERRPGDWRQMERLIHDRRFLAGLREDRGHIGGLHAARNGATIVVVPGYSASVPERTPRMRCGGNDPDTGLRG